jgi:hypothetical protein
MWGRIQIWVYRSAINPSEMRFAREICAEAHVKYASRVKFALAGELRCRTFGSVHFYLIETRRVSFHNSPNGRISHAQRAYFTPKAFHTPQGVFHYCSLSER